MTSSEKACRTIRPTRDTILDAALTLFGQRGFDGTTTKEIASKAGVNEVTLFRQFRTKGELYDAVLNLRYPYSKISMAVHYDRNTSIEKALYENSRTILKVLRDEHNLFDLLIMDLPRRDRSGRMGQTLLTTSLIGPLAAYLSTQAEKGVIRPMDFHLAAQTFFGAIFFHYQMNYLMGAGGGNNDDDQYLRALVKTFIEGVRVTADEGGHGEGGLAR